MVLAVFLLLCSRATLKFEYDGEIRLRISWLFVTIFKCPAVRKKNRKKDAADKKTAEDVLRATAETARAAADKKAKKRGAEKRESGGAKELPSKKGGEKKDKNKLSLCDIYELVKLILDSLGKPLKKLLRRARICHLAVDIVCGGEDAAKAALNYGRANILVGNALGWMDCFFTLKPPDDIHIGVNFQREETEAYFRCVLKLSVFAALAFLFTLLGRAFLYYKRNSKAATAVRKITSK